LNEEFIVIGKVVSTYGNKGEIKVVPLTDSTGRFKDLVNVFIRKSNSREILKINSLRIKKNNIILKLKDVGSIEEAKVMVGCFLEVKRKNTVKLPKDSYFIFDIIGLEVYTNKNIFLGKVEDIITTGSNDVYIVKNRSNQEILIPAIHDVIKDIDLKKRRITINIVDGLI
jgi:16S rRNA processing protein RimM